MFGTVPRPLWSAFFSPDESGRIDLVSRILIARFPEERRVVVVDSGLGNLWEKRLKERYKIDSSMPLPADSLEALGISAQEITDAIMTHLHFDHAGGWVAKDETGGLKPVFSRARHHVQRAQWDWAMQPSVKDKASFVSKHYSPIDEAGLLSFVEGEKELFPGLEILVSRGHTPGMQIPILRGEGRTVAFAADLLPTTAHVRTAWTMAYDLHPLDILEEKRRLLTEAAKEGWIIILEHDPRFEAVIVSRDGDDFTFESRACPEVL